MLKGYGFPENFINLVKAMYSKSKTSIMINGVIPAPIKVDRGVQQGDPMSCLLYNLAIEPLAVALRASTKLKGIQIRDHVKLIAKLFADDTLVYLGSNDKFSDLEELINLFCKASTARFNMEKTEALPIGLPTYREKVLTERSLGANTNKIPEYVRLIKDGEPMRTLGAWVGNGITIEDKWNKIIEVQRKVMDVWASSHPTLRGKELVLKALVTSRSWFLAAVNGMPDHIEREITKTMKDFIWNGNQRGLMRLDYTAETREKGGLGIPDLKTRMKAIDIMWLKKFLDTPEKRPTWCWVADALISGDAYLHSTPKVDDLSRIKWALQTWRTRQGKHSKLPECLKRMLKVAEKYNTRVLARKTDSALKNDMIIWHHTYGDKNNYVMNKAASKCLRRKHKLKTVGDIDDYVKKCRTGAVRRCKKGCQKMAEQLLKSLGNKWNPIKCTPYKDNLDHTPRRAEANKKVGNVPALYNPDITERGSPEKAIRIFINKPEKGEGEYRPVHRKHTYPQNVWNIYTDGACLEGNTSRARAGAGIFCMEDETKNRALRIPGTSQTNQRGELMAIVKALTIVPKGDKLTVISDSMYALQGVVENLRKWEDQGWMRVQNADIFQKIAYELDTRGGETYFQWIKGHSGDPGNYGADAKATRVRKRRWPTASTSESPKNTNSKELD